MCWWGKYFGRMGKRKKEYIGQESKPLYLRWNLYLSFQRGLKSDRTTPPCGKLYWVKIRKSELDRALISSIRATACIYYLTFWLFNVYLPFLAAKLVFSQPENFSDPLKNQSIIAAFQTLQHKLQLSIHGAAQSSHKVRKLKKEENIEKDRIEEELSKLGK